jgi:hypothetical protein
MLKEALPDNGNPRRGKIGSLDRGTVLLGLATKRVRSTTHFIQITQACTQPVKFLTGTSHATS